MKKKGMGVPTLIHIRVPFLLQNISQTRQSIQPVTNNVATAPTLRYTNTQSAIMTRTVNKKQSSCLEKGFPKKKKQNRPFDAPSTVKCALRTILIHKDLPYFWCLLRKQWNVVNLSNNFCNKSPHSKRRFVQLTLLLFQHIRDLSTPRGQLERG